MAMVLMRGGWPPVLGKLVPGQSGPGHCPADSWAPDSCPGPSGIGVEHCVFWMIYLILRTVNLIFWRTFYFLGGYLVI